MKPWTLAGRLENIYKLSYFDSDFLLLTRLEMHTHLICSVVCAIVVYSLFSRAIWICLYKENDRNLSSLYIIILSWAKDMQPLRSDHVLRIYRISFKSFLISLIIVPCCECESFILRKMKWIRRPQFYSDSCSLFLGDWILQIFRARQKMYDFRVMRCMKPFI